MLINGEIYVPWDHFKVQLNLATRYREALEVIANNQCPDTPAEYASDTLNNRY